MSTPLVSIIVPVYNCERFLPDCLDSLLAQGLPSFEIVCVNDGSTDNSPTILERYSLKYPEIRVIQQHNSGVSAARNRGLALARGKYVCFCDSDDLLAKGILVQALQALETRNAEAAFFEMQRVPENFHVEQKTVSVYPVTVGMDERVQKNLYVFLLLISRELIMENSLCFLEGLRYSEDELFVLDLLRFVKSEQVIHIYGTGYLHRKNSSSVMNASKWHRAPRHYEAMKIFAKELRARTASGEVVPVELRRRTHQAVSNALYDGFFMEKAPEEILAELTAEALYPYPLQWETLKIADLKTTISNYIRFLFPFRRYYLLICKLVRMGLKLYKKE